MAVIKRGIKTEPSSTTTTGTNNITSLVDAASGRRKRKNKIITTPRQYTPGPQLPSQKPLTKRNQTALQRKRQQRAEKAVSPLPPKNKRVWAF